MRTIYLEYHDEPSHKAWKLEIDDLRTLVTFGKVGTELRFAKKNTDDAGWMNYDDKSDLTAFVAKIEK
ncbi:hypothetical protein TL16_g07978 [Triparma laevis f. inornata]|uniref:Uncharacterized protein n=2 Tax=Triparma laevis TaxID=1534972 RepID=A0A9W6ZVE0_9STRA|nr:hypothetical protein TrLO_g228 [Triparma laevis f. longispina]GMH78924.1 hypothetical protein TL16_g07978 [Triparma laevis f. inornata]